MNRWRTPRAVAGDPRSARLIGRSIRIELAIVILILGLVAAWRFTPPPRALLVAAGEPVHVHIHAERAMADLQISRSRGEGGRITLNLLDGQFRPLAAKEITLVLSKPDAGIEPLRLTARPVEATTWQIDDVRLPMTGRWRVRVEILISDFEKIAIEDQIDLAP
jgi:copper transport protein